MITRCACRVLKHFTQAGSIKPIYSIQGLLLDKVSGAYHVKAQLELVNIATHIGSLKSVRVQVVYVDGELRNSEQLKSLLYSIL